MKFHWFLPTSGDSRQLIGGGHGLNRDHGHRGGYREPDIEYLA
jgi:hypothetical protein